MPSKRNSDQSKSKSPGVEVVRSPLITAGDLYLVALWTIASLILAGLIWESRANLSSTARVLLIGGATAFLGSMLIAYYLRSSVRRVTMDPDGVTLRLPLAEVRDRWANWEVADSPAIGRMWEFSHRTRRDGQSFYRGYSVTLAQARALVLYSAHASWKLSEATLASIGLDRGTVDRVTRLHSSPTGPPDGGTSKRPVQE
jgi:hypothetical protein